MKSVSVIVPTFRDGQALAKCLAALCDQTYPRNLIEIIFVDNTPEFELGGDPEPWSPARIIHEPKSGSYAARNFGIANASGDVLAFTDADCVPEPNWLSEGLRELERFPGGAYLAGRIEVFPRNRSHPSAVELFQVFQAFPQELYIKVHKFGATANVFVSRNVIDKVGEFNDALMSGGDGEFGRRVNAKDIPLIYSGTAVVRHPARRSMSDLLKKTRRVTQGVLAMEKSGRLPPGSFRRGILKDLRPPVVTCWHIFHSEKLKTIGQRLKVMAVLVAWRYYRATYRLWLICGPYLRLDLSKGLP